jgi:hypothetical protein
VETFRLGDISIVVTSSLGVISIVAAWGHYQSRATCRRIMHGRRILTCSGFGACTSTEVFGEKLATSNSCVLPSSNRLARCFAIRQLYGWHTPSGAITLACFIDPKTRSWNS